VYCTNNIFGVIGTVHQSGSQVSMLTIGNKTALSKPEIGFPVCQDRGLMRSEAEISHKCNGCRRKRSDNSYDNFLSYLQTIRFSFLHNLYCPIIQYVLCRNWKILLRYFVFVCQYILRSRK
jgi:hypothetical protein